MEVAGLVLGVAGVVGVYSTCLDLVDRFQVAKHIGSRDAITHLEVIRHLIRRWGEAVGIKDGTLLPAHHVKLDDNELRTMVYSVLGTIERHLLDTKALSTKYGLERERPTEVSSVETVTDFVVKMDLGFSRTQRTVSKRRKLLWAIKDEKSFNDFVATLGALVSQLYQIVNPDDEENSIALRDLSTSIEGFEAFVKDEVEEVKKMLQEQVNSSALILSYIKSEERARDIKFLAAPFPEEDLDHAIRHRTPDTCEWIVQSDELVSWRFGSYTTVAPKLLWIHGGPGSGKTFLAAKIVQYLKLSTSTPVAYFFCRHDDGRKSQPMNIIRSWTSSICAQDERAMEILVETRKSVGGDQAIVTTTIDLFKRCLEIFPKSYFIVDGFDECSDIDQSSPTQMPGERAAFFKILTDMVFGTSAQFIVVSRRNEDLARMLYDATTTENIDVLELTVTPASTRNDIEKFVQSRLNSNRASRSRLRNSDLASKLADHVEGGFLLARLQSDRIRPLMNEQQIQGILDQVPARMEILYAREMEDIKRLESMERDRAISLLRAVTFANRPLTPKELVEAAALQTRQHDITDELMAESEEDILHELLRLCGSFLVEQKTAMDMQYPWMLGATKELETTVHLVHFSLKEFLLRILFSSPQGDHLILATSCIRCLDSREVRQDWDAQDRPKFDNSLRNNIAWMKRLIRRSPFLVYAAYYWNYHCDQLGQCDSPLDLLLCDFLFQLPRKTFTAWVYLRYNGINYRRKEVDMLNGIGATHYFLSLLHIRPIYRFSEELHSTIISKRLDLYSEPVSLELLKLSLLKDDPNPSAVRLARDFLDAHKPLTLEWVNSVILEIVRIVCQHQSNSFGLDVVKLLVDTASAKRESSDRTVLGLEEACRHGHWPLVQLLLPPSLVPSLALQWFENFLLVPLEIVEGLLSSGADPGTEKKNKCLPLHKAVQDGRTDIVEVLLKHGANVNCQFEIFDYHSSVRNYVFSTNEGYGSALDIALANGLYDIVELLLKHSANPEGRLKYVKWGQIPSKILEQLLINGANPNDDIYGHWPFKSAKPLHYAYRYDRLDLIDVLVAYGARLPSRLGNLNELQTATAVCLEGRVGQLLTDENGPNIFGPLPTSGPVNFLDKSKVDLFSHADYRLSRSRWRHQCDIYSTLDYSGSLLHLAVLCSSPGIIEAMLLADADLTIQDSFGLTPLDSAEVHEYEEAAAVLRAHGALRNFLAQIKFLSACETYLGSTLFQLIRELPPDRRFSVTECDRLLAENSACKLEWRAKTLKEIFDLS